MKRFGLKIVACILCIILAGAGCAVSMLAEKEYAKHELEKEVKDKKENEDKTKKENEDKTK